MAVLRLPVSCFQNTLTSVQVLVLVVSCCIGACLGNVTPRPTECVHNGKSYQLGQEIFRSQIGDWCYGTACSPKGLIVRWDNFRCSATTEGCVVNGKTYKPGQDISEKQTGSWCYGKFCSSSGDLIVWNDYDCVELTTTPPPVPRSSVTKKKSYILEQAGEVTLTSQPANATPAPPTQVTPIQPTVTCTYGGVTYQPGDQIPDGKGCGFECSSQGELLPYPCEPPTTTPNTPPPRGCFYNGNYFPPDSLIEQGPRADCGVLCTAEGEVVHSSCGTPTTTMPPTTEAGCFYNGHFYRPNQALEPNAFGCGGFCTEGGEVVLATCTTSSTTLTTTIIPTTTMPTTSEIRCIYNGQFYLPGAQIPDGKGCGFECSSQGELLPYPCAPPTTTPNTPPPRGCFYNGNYFPRDSLIEQGPRIDCGVWCTAEGEVIHSSCGTPTTTMPPTTEAGCFYNGHFYRPNQALEPNAFGCGGFCMEGGEVVLATCTTSSTTLTTLPVPTTTPRGCFYNGQFYPPNGVIFQNALGCGAYCTAEAEIVQTTCTTRPPITTIPTTITTPRGCQYNGQFYPPNQIIYMDAFGCGAVCSSEGQVIQSTCTTPTPPTSAPPPSTVSVCLFNGVTYQPDQQISGQGGCGLTCGPNGMWQPSPCTTPPTSVPTPQTTTTSSLGCLVNGKLFKVGEEITRERSSQMCYGTLCDQNGDVISWEDFTCGLSTGNTVAPNEPVKDCDYQGQKYKPGQKIISANSQGCTVYCSLEGRVRVQRFPCVTLITSTAADVSENSTRTGNLVICRSENGTYGLCSGGWRVGSSFTTHIAVLAFVLLILTVNGHH